VQKDVWAASLEVVLAECCDDWEGCGEPHGWCEQATCSPGVQLKLGVQAWVHMAVQVPSEVAAQGLDQSRKIPRAIFARGQ
jgi:hypothetical protein